MREYEKKKKINLTNPLATVYQKEKLNVANALPYTRR